MMMRMRVRVAMWLCLWLFAGLLQADQTLLKKHDAKIFIKKMVKQHGFKRTEVIHALKEAAYKPRIIELMNQPYEQKTWDVYRALFLTPERVEGGVKFWHDNQEALVRAEKMFGVPAAMIVAILGVETRYGESQGTYRVLDALTTLAFYYPKRSAYFERELEEYFLLCREHQVPVTEYVGSYAGAIGQPQFMPSNYRMYAVDFKKQSGSGHPDLVHESKDVIVSVANYFKRHGWQPGEEVIEPVRVKGTAHQTLQANARYPNYPYEQLLQSGVQPIESLKQIPSHAGLIKLQLQDNSTVYWLAYPNFYVIMRYNTSPQYALVVHLLSRQLQERFKAEQV